MRALLLLINPRPHQTMFNLSLSWTVSDWSHPSTLSFFLSFLLLIYFDKKNYSLSFCLWVIYMEPPRGPGDGGGGIFYILNVGVPSQKFCAPPRNFVSLKYKRVNAKVQKNWKLSTNRLLFLLPAQVLSAKFLGKYQTFARYSEECW